MENQKIHWKIICSPVSGKKQGKKFVENQLIPELKQRGISFEVFYTEHFQHAKQLAEKFNNIICVGGDGTCNEVLESCPPNATLAIVSQGTMNFFGVCADLPNDVKQIVDLIASNTTRPCSLMKITTYEGPKKKNQQVSFEALHFGKMPYRVCKGAQDYRFTLGPMFGIVLNLILGNLFPKNNLQKGALTFWPANGDPIVRITDHFFWIIVTYRNPYNGVVGNEMWISWMTFEQFPGFDRMMKFFEPQMEHFQGTSRCFGCHSRANRVEFTLSDSESGDVALVLDGDPKPNCGRTVAISNTPNCWNVVANSQLPTSVNTNRIAVGGGPITPKPLTKAGKAWLKMNPPPRGCSFPLPLPITLEDDDAKSTGSPLRKILLAGALILVANYIRKRIIERMSF